MSAWSRHARRALEVAVVCMGAITIGDVPSANADDVAGEPPASAQASKHEEPRIVHLMFAETVDASLASAVKEDLAAELSSRAIEVTDLKQPTGVVLADVSVKTESAQLIVLEVTDRMTDKRVTRKLSLARLPENGRALAIAIAIDELLRASWAELTLSTRKEAAPVLETARADATPKSKGTRETPVWLTLGATTLNLPSKLNMLGASLSADVIPFGALWIHASAGFDHGFAKDVSAGSFSSSGFSTRTGLGGCRVRSWTMCLGAEALVDVLSLEARERHGAETRGSINPLIGAAGVFSLFLPVSGPIAAHARVSLGTTVLGIEITDGTRTLSTLNGVLLGAVFGLGVSL